MRDTTDTRDTARQAFTRFLPRAAARRLVVALLVAAPGLLAGCGDTGPEPEGSDADQPVQVTYDYHTTQTRAGIPQWELWGSTAARFAGKEGLFLSGVRMVFYRDGEAKATLTSKTGEVDEETQDMTARGDVVVVTPEGKVLQSEVLHWNNRQGRIYTDAFVRFEDGDQILTGVGMETDPDLNDLVIFRQVEGDVPPATSAKTEGRR